MMNTLVLVFLNFLGQDANPLGRHVNLERVPLHTNFKYI